MFIINFFIDLFQLENKNVLLLKFNVFSLHV